MVAEVAIRITADGKAVVAAAQQATDALQGISNQAGKTSTTLQDTQKSSAGLNASFADMGKAGIVFAAVNSAASGLLDVMTRLPTSGIQFAAQIEVTNVGMAGILSSMTAINGRATTYAQGLEIASGITAKLQRDAMLTAASTKELVNAFQAMVGPGLAAGMSLDQIRQFATVGVNAVKSLGLEGTQIVQELRDLVQGGITPASSTLATALGLKDSDIAKAKASSEGLFSFLMGKMKGFAEAGPAYAQTFTGVMEQMQEQLVKSAATVFAPLAGTLKEQAKGITDALGNETNVAQLSKLTGSIQLIAGALGTATQFAIAHSEAIVTVVQVYGGLKMGTMVAGWVASTEAMLQASAASRLVAMQAAAEAVANTEVTLTARQKIAAYLAELAAKQASAEATVAETAGRIAFLNVSVAALELSRSEVVAKMASTRSTIAQAQAQLAAAQAAGAQSFSLAIAAEATNTLSVAQARQSVLMAEMTLLGQQQTGVHAAIAAATAAQTLATEGAALATNQLGAAQRAASVSGTAMGSVIGALGGPVGIAIAAVSVLVGVLMAMNSEADKAAKTGLSKDRVDANSAQGKKSESRDTSAIDQAVSQLKDKRDELLIDQKNPGVLSYLLKSDYQIGMKTQMDAINGQVTALEASSATAAAIVSKTGTEVQINGATATKALDDLLGKEKTVTSLTAKAKEETAALVSELAKVKLNTNVSPEVATAKENEVAEAKKAIAVKLQGDLKQLREKGMGEAQAQAKSLLAGQTNYYEQLQTVVSGGEKRTQAGLSAQHAAGLISDESYYTQKRDMALVSNTGMQTLVQLEIASVQKSTLLQKDKIAAIAKYDSELTKLRQDELGITTAFDDEMLKADAKVRAEYSKVMTEYTQKSYDARKKETQAITDYGTAIDDQNALTQLELSLAGSTAQAREIALGQYRVELDLKKQLKAINAVQGQGDEFDKWKADETLRATEAAARASAGLQSKVSVDEWKKSVEKYDDIFRTGFADMVNNGSSAWGSFTKSLATTFKTSVADQIYKMFAQPFVMRLVASLIGVGGGALGLAGSASAGQGGAGNSLSVLQSIKSVYDTITTGFTGLSAGVTNFLSVSSANVAGTGLDGMLAANGAYGTSASGAGWATSIGSAVGVAAGAAAGLAIGTVISGEYGSSGTVIAGTAIGAAVGSIVPVIGTAVGAALGGAIGGLVNRMFGMGNTEVQSSGMRGTFSQSGFAGNNYANMHQSGGWFRSDKDWTETSALAAGVADSMTQSFIGTKVAVAQVAASLGLSVDTILTYSKSIDLAAGTTAEQMTAMFMGMADDMATAVAPGLAALAKSGEAANVTLSRLSTSLTTSNAWLSLLQQRLFQVSLAGGDAASKLADAFGGLSNLTAASKTFYETYYTEGERAARSQSDMAAALSMVNLAMPSTKDELRALAGTLDLNTESGRRAYAVLLAIAPEFAATADIIVKLAGETAVSLMKAVVGGWQLVPALDTAALKVSDFTGAATVLSGEMSYINSIMGDSTSSVIGFSDGSYVLGTNLSQSQLSAKLLNSQVIALKDNADKTRINFVGLGEALVDVNTETFVATIGLVFENLASRIQGIIGDINTERIAVRDAALSIINPTVMSKTQIEYGIAGINTVLPSNTGVQSANLALVNADANAAQSLDKTRTARALFENAQVNLSSASAAASRISAADAAYEKALAMRQADPSRTDILDLLNNAAGFMVDTRGRDSALAATAPAANAEYARSAAVLAANLALQSAAEVVQSAAQLSAKNSIIDYASALQNFTIDASKSVGKLTKLREETVKYYEAQSKLASLMETSAAGIRSTISAYTFSQKTDEQKFQDLAGQFSTSYTLSKVTTGETLAGYGDKINALINPMIEALKATGRDNLIASYLAQAEAVAANVDNGVLSLGNYQQDSLGMLGSIDATLAALDASSQSAERIISDAVRAGSDKTAAGLHAVIAALTGQAVPAFAAGGIHTGGWRLVGENGPEMENTGPSQIFNASQTRGMFSGGGSGGGGNADIVSELRFLRRDNAAMRAELQAIASHTNKTARLLDRAMPDGDALATRVTA